MSTFLIRCAFVAVPMFVIGPAKGAYNPGVVAADARWVVFADFETLRSSSLGKELVSSIAAVQSQATGGIIGLDVAKVLTTVGSLTAYGTNLLKDPAAIDGALVAQGTADLRKIVESVMLQGTLAQPDVFSEVTDLPFPAYAISDPKAPDATKMQVIVAFPPEPIVLVSKSKAQLVKARDVVRGAAPSLAKGGARELRSLDAKTTGAYLFAASVVPTEPIFPQNAPQARVLQLARSGAIVVGETGPDLFAHAELLASSDQNAEKLMKILQGMTAMLSLAETNDQHLGEFLNASTVTREKEAVTLHIAYPTARLAQMTQALRTSIEAKPVNRQPSIIHGTAVAEWRADEADAPESSEANALTWRTIENVRLVTGSTVSLGRWLNGGKNARFNRVELVPADGGGSPLVFRNEFMRNFRGTMSQFQFPGTDGVYTLKVAYVNDPDRKAKYAVSVRNPNDPEQPPSPPSPPSKGPSVPGPKWKR
jgi:hypothetical protein